MLLFSISATDCFPLHSPVGLGASICTQKVLSQQQLRWVYVLAPPDYRFGCPLIFQLEHLYTVCVFSDSFLHYVNREQKLTTCPADF